MGGAAAGKFKVKSCGKAHAWCGKCRPEQAERQRAPKPVRKQYEDQPCRNCGRCDACRGLTAPPGFKVCRRCEETKPITAFSRRNDTGGYRNQCIKCRNSRMEAGRCEGCGKTFARHSSRRTLCARCRPEITTPCAWCGTEFYGSMAHRMYCSKECQRSRLAEQRAAAHRTERLAALNAYGGPAPECSCCGESGIQFLALDHVHGGGGRHRKETGGGGFYAWLRRNNYPSGFQILCHNCNMGRQLNGGVCPHVEKGQPVNGAAMLVAGM